MILLPNVLLSTARASYNPLTKQTSAAEPYLSAIPAHIAPVTARHLALLPEAAVGSEYYALVASGTDIAIQDELTSIVLPDGITPWPGDVIPAGNANAPTITWRVQFVQESAPGLLTSRKIYLTRALASGPTHV